MTQARRFDPRTDIWVGVGSGRCHLRRRRVRPECREDARAAPVVPIRVRECPGHVLAVPDLFQGQLSELDRETLAAARGLADRSDLLLTVAAFDAAPLIDWTSSGADRLIRLSRNREYEPCSDLRSIARVIDELAPAHIVFPDSLPGMGDVGRRLVAARTLSFAANVRSLAKEGAIVQCAGSKEEMTSAPPRVLFIAQQSRPLPSCVRWEARPLDVAIAAGGQNEDVEILGSSEIDVTTLPLAQAELVLAAGDGVTDWRTFGELARALNATIGATRVVCDKGLLPRSRQVGTSGEAVAARGYLAFGIAGAAQHLQGIVRCEHVVAVNTDLFSDMVKRADLAIIGDAQAVMPELLRQIERDRACDRPG